jgi:outer membrane protein OmpA-like peptidoglycan-associated protein
MRQLHHLLIAVACASALGSAGGCAHAPPPELVSARQAYQHASAGPAGQVVPADLHKARESLAQAEQEFANDPNGQRARDLAYVAERKAQLAEALAAADLDHQAKARADRDYQSQQAKIVQQTRTELTKAREQVADTERARAQDAQQLSQEQQARLSAERKATEAEQKATEAEQQAREALVRLAAVREEQRGLVITLSGSVLFPSDQATLLPEAQTRLNQVAEALLATKGRTLVIEGHTDARGSADHNLDLSQRRAEAVRIYLISRGYPADKIIAQGLGKARPVADNASAEGRANNRRVEIVVPPKDKAYTQRGTDLQ